MNLGLLLDAIGTMYPDREAIWEPAGSCTYAELQALATDWAELISARSGSGPVLYVGLASATFVSVLFGSAYSGRLFVPANYRLKEMELIHCARTVTPSIVVCDDRYRTLVESAVRELALDSIVVSSSTRPSRDSSGAEREPREGPAVGLFTSGTTSAPKLVLLSHANLAAYVLNTVDAGSAREHEGMLLSTPPYHIAAIAAVLTNVFRARRLVLLGQFDPENWLAIARAQAATHAMVVPTMLKRILDVLDARPDLAPTSLSSLAYGGAKMPDGLLERAMRTLPPSVGLVNAFGLTETSSTVSLLSPEDHRAAVSSDDPAVRARLHSAGRPVPGVEIKIVAEDGREVPVGAEGEVWIRGPQVANVDAADASRADDEDWLHTGDLGHVDSSGYLFVHGRRDDVIIRGGENINPHEIEAVLLAHPAVEDAVVIGVPDLEWGQAIGALAVGSNTTAAELQAWLAGRIAGYKVPRQIVFVDELPKNDAGKVVRRRAREMLLTGPPSVRSDPARSEPS